MGRRCHLFIKRKVASSSRLFHLTNPAQILIIVSGSLDKKKDEKKMQSFIKRKAASSSRLFCLTNPVHVSIVPGARWT
jgi:hypothetical protein